MVVIWANLASHPKLKTAVTVGFNCLCGSYMEVRIVAGARKELVAFAQCPCCTREVDITLSAPTIRIEA